VTQTNNCRVRDGRSLTRPNPNVCFLPGPIPGKTFAKECCMRTFESLVISPDEFVQLLEDC
jgi:hypothetical protein